MGKLRGRRSSATSLLTMRPGFPWHAGTVRMGRGVIVGVCVSGIEVAVAVGAGARDGVEPGAALGAG